MDLTKNCYGDEENDGKKMAELDALKQLKKFIASDWMKKYLEKSEGEEPSDMSDDSSDPMDAAKEALAETDSEEAPSSLKDELMQYMKPKVKERRPGTAVMIAVEKKSPMKKGFPKKKMG